MYLPTKPILWTEVDPQQGLRSHHDYLNSNGTYVRFDNGQIVGREDGSRSEVVYCADMAGDVVVGAVTDKLLVERIPYYWEHYFGQRHTNCASFAHYLTTGKFVECVREKRLFVLEQGMRPYDMVNRVDVGDMACILYGEKRIMRSRRHAFGRHFREMQKHRHDRGGFVRPQGLQLKQRPFSPEEIYSLYQAAGGDFHFMVCVDKRDGQPVWLSQAGQVPPGGPRVAFAITVGEEDPYLPDVPAFAFIKKRR